LIPTGSTAPLRKGVEFDVLHVVLPGSATRVVIDGESGPTDVVGFASDVEVASVNATLAERTAVDFGTPIDEFIFTGGGFFAGLVPAPVAPGSTRTSRWRSPMRCWEWPSRRPPPSCDETVQPVTNVVRMAPSSGVAITTRR
jgi:hypothetical protein